MTKSKYPFVDKTQRNKDIIELRNKGTRYKAIAREVGCTAGVVTAVLKKLSHDLQLEKAGYVHTTMCLRSHLLMD
jgi:transcriptional regulator